MPNYFNNVMFPYPSMQQLNLDWIMHRVGEMPTVINLPAAANTEILDVIDDNIDDIPIGFSMLAFGSPAIDPIGKCGMFVMIKQDTTHFNYFGTCASGAFMRGVRDGTATGSVYSPGPVPFSPNP